MTSTEPTTTPNADLLDLVLHTVTARATHGPDCIGRDWDQSVWHTNVLAEDGTRCGTAYCFAGWTVELSDRAQWIDPTDLMVVVELEDATKPLETTVPVAARRLLGLTTEQANLLFDADNTLDQVAGHVAAIKAGTLE